MIISILWLQMRECTVYASRLFRRAVFEVNTSLVTSSIPASLLRFFYSYIKKNFQSRWKRHKIISGIYHTHEREMYINGKGKKNKQNASNTSNDTVIMTLTLWAGPSQPAICYTEKKRTNKVKLNKALQNNV